MFFGAFVSGKQKSAQLFLISNMHPLQKWTKMNAERIKKEKANEKKCIYLSA